jgi:beta-1,4-mannosyl-glycoprotein beta-1,4-N-acetylglucosaminyltransferase
MIGKKIIIINMKIYDVFPIFNELELIEIRLELMYDYVDYFVISECDYTFSGLPKPFNFEDNKEKFSKYMDKIIYLKHYNTDKFTNLVNKYEGEKGKLYQNIINQLDIYRKSAQTGYGQPHWCRDYLHKELSMLGLSECDADDLIIFGDIDEIPNPEKLIFDGESYCLGQKNMLYYANNENVTEKWYGTIISKYSNLVNNSCMLTRDNRKKMKIIGNAGWHLTCLGGKDMVEDKIKSWGHQELNTPNIINNVSKNITNNTDIFNRKIQLKTISMDEYYPESMVSFIIKKFKHLIK